MNYYVNYTGICHIGKIRKNNQDSIVCNNQHISDCYLNEYQHTSGCTSVKKTSVFGVFDGMGGLSHGEIASSLAAKTIADFKLGNKPISKLLDYCMHTNSLICNYSKQNCFDPMGTTAALLAFSKHGIALCNIGDSKIFRFDNGCMEQISQDHITSCTWNNKKLLTQNLGIPTKEMKISPYLAKGHYQAGDIYLICSDGLTDMVSEKQIKQTVFESPIETAGQKLLKIALDSGGNDNISIVLCQIIQTNLHKHFKGEKIWNLI